MRLAEISLIKRTVYTTKWVSQLLSIWPGIILDLFLSFQSRYQVFQLPLRKMLMLSKTFRSPC